MKDISQPLIIGHFFDGPPDPTLELDFVSVDGVRLFTELISSVASDEPVNVHDHPLVHLANVDRFQLRRSEAPQSPHFRKANNDFELTATAAEWREIQHMLEPFLEGRTGHQYLTDDVLDDAVLEVSLGERSVEYLRSLLGDTPDPT